MEMSKVLYKILTSTETLAPQNKANFDQLKLKHPPLSKVLIFPAPPDENSDPLTVSEQDVFRKIDSFPNGSVCGVNGILPHVSACGNVIKTEAGWFWD